MPLPLDTSKPLVLYDIAYACFFLCGLVVIVFGIAEFTTIIRAGAYFFFGVLVPLTFVFLIVFVVGVGFSLWLWRHVPLPILSALTVLVIVAFITSVDSDEYWEFLPAVTWAYGIIATVVPLGWFLFFRWHAHGAMGTDKSRPLYRGAQRVHYDIAYVCFLVFGLTALFGVVSAPSI